MVRVSSVTFVRLGSGACSPEGDVLREGLAAAHQLDACTRRLHTVHAQFDTAMTEAPAG